jgi:hypothetical protein
MPDHAAAQNVPALYHGLIDWIGDGTGMSDTILHIHAGMAIFLITRLITGRSLGSLIPWSVVALAELGNEVLDRLHYGSWRLPDTTSDVINTLFWPTVIFLAIRFQPVIESKRLQPAASRR